MHLLVRESRALDAEGEVFDHGQSPADIVFCSFSDSDLGAAAAAWAGLPEPRPGLRLANLARLRHPMSVDVYVDDVIAQARCVVLRVLGGFDYWPYGIEQVAATCRARGMPLAVVPGDARDDPRLAAAATVDAETLAKFDAYLSQGGETNLCNALLLAARLAGVAAADPAPCVSRPSAAEFVLDARRDGRHGGAAVVFYRSQVLAGDTAPVTALARALAVRGLGVRAMYVSSLKDPAAAAYVADWLRAWRPAVVINLTGFSAGRDGASPLDAAGAPVLQAVLANGAREAWVASSRGLSRTDMAMQVVLPELDGRLLTAAISFKSEADTVAGLEFSRVVHVPDDAGVSLAADRALGWARLAATPARDRRVAVLLSDYPGAGGGQVGHAVGLDTLASAETILGLLAGAGYTVGGADLAELTGAAPRAIIDLETYAGLFSTLPETFRQRVTECWGDPAAGYGLFHAVHVTAGNLLVAVQPDRGHVLDRKAGYHDPDLAPRHEYIAFYLWLREVFRADAVVHLGAHGTLEWLPGKAVALSAECAPTALIRGLPVIYPFIVNNPGEAAAAKRRLGAVTIGHLTPPMAPAGTHGAAAELERLVDEYATADGLDGRRATLLRAEILSHAAATGLLAESGVAPGEDNAEALARLDAYLCDLKELPISDGLHVFAVPPADGRRSVALAELASRSPGLDSKVVAAAWDASAPAEAAALLAALNGRFVRPGPAGAPTRGGRTFCPLAATCAPSIRVACPPRPPCAWRNERRRNCCAATGRIPASGPARW